ncbi:sigma-G-dependent sporulation-specific acid-soluble spore protein CsgA [Mesobacillus maritimus]|uniref:sigma-G-dependent sporulation-specific acid-soluble spore protein CsgA n=1 Tax=Mesobacillus maritimus TaxID=1643336 RepID=UPI00203B9EB2|nr:sigma-G-dependent sporulation-specific acid-soluble spore protein CsgA [Mesobacillus maritimus]MCM3588109.1 sigma-G-dependent sporulation-specific acid-soluble spore protein CsgA [Mesobacillus maritimus]MCM3668439.1 sigma-G-dependent sporulation-specific acid-soluble spore protein CsgA [Mesobacillus maritimus]
MEQTLAYLREILANYTEKDETSRQIYRKLENGHYHSEGDLVRDLTFEETEYLNGILPWEIRYAKNEQDEQRAYQLNEVYELLF